MGNDMTTASSSNSAAAVASGTGVPTVRTPRLQIVVVALIIAALALVPVLSNWAGQSFYVVILTRILVFSLAAMGLNLVLGYGAMVSFGHALYIGIGAYAVGILSSHGISNGYIHVLVACAVGLVSAVLIGSVCLRAGGVAFIMITLAFAQMFYFLAVGLRQYGGDEGLPIATRSDFKLFSLDDQNVLYYLVFALLIATLYGLHRLVHSRFGMVLRGCKANERRMLALGYSTFRYKLSAYVISALICVLAGVMLANLTRFASPSYMAWSVSGELMVMVVLGGIGTLMGPFVGASIWLVMEELMTSFRMPLPWGMDALVRDHWLGVFGLVVVLVALYLRYGVYGMLLRYGRGRS